MAIGLWEAMGEAVSAVRSRVNLKPSVAVILGTGLGGFGDEIEGAQSLAYAQIPHFPRSTVAGHKGQLVFGRVQGKSAVVMEGRFHVYEGYSAREVTFPVRVMNALGATTLIVSNAAGGLNPDFAAGDLMAITDHINLMGVNPLMGPNDERLGERFPDMSCPYDPRLLSAALKIAREEKFPLRQGVYAAVAGPNLETKAEYRFLRGIGADSVGMSTVPEVLAAVHAKMRVFAVSCVTDLCVPETLKPACLEEILKVAQKAQPRLTTLISRLIEKI